MKYWLMVRVLIIRFMWMIIRGGNGHMNYTKEYLTIRGIPIVKKLEKTEYGKKFENLVGYAAPKLDRGPFLKEIGFTPHDFSHHVKDIYSLLSKMIPDGFYKEYDKGENLFILLTSVLFHDFGMTKEWNDEVRSQHSKIGKEMFLEPFVKNDVSSVIKQNIDSKYSEYIGDIICAHSDIKCANGTKVETFRQISSKYDNLEYGTEGEQETINVPFLAALVRLADELDITYERIENIDYLRANNLPSSIEHFKLCELIKAVQLGKRKDTLIIIVDKSKCRLDLLAQNGNDYHQEDILKTATQAANILERYEKIQEEFKMINELVLRNTSYSSDKIWKIRRIELDYADELVEAAKKKEFFSQMITS